MTNDQADGLLVEIREIRKLIELMAEPAIAQRDARLRDELRKIATSAKRQKAVFLMDGSRAQKDIITATSIHKGDLSTIVTKLEEAGLLTGDKKLPKLAISIPQTFFDAKPTT